MLLAHLEDRRVYEPLVANAAINHALEWIRSLPTNQPDGLVSLSGKQMFANVHGYDTLPREQCDFECHRAYVDLQYCISGGECIDFCRREGMLQKTDYDLETDFQFFRPSKEHGVLHLAPGFFAIFFPDDAHRPKIFDGVNRRIRKLVVKISTSLFAV